MATAEMAPTTTKKGAAKLAPTECGGTMLPHRQADVGGRLRCTSAVVCPWCGSNAFREVHPTFFECLLCGGTFRASSLRE